MRNSLYISSHEKSTGSFVLSIGMMHQLKKLFNKVGFFRPISLDTNNIVLINDYFKIDEKIENCYGVSTDDALKLISDNKINDLSTLVLEKYEKYKKKYDFVLIQGFNYSSLDFAISKDFNIDLAKNLDSVFMPVFNGHNKSIANMKKMLTMEKRYIQESKVSHLYSMITRIKEDNIEKVKASIGDDTLIMRACSKINLLSLEHIRAHLKCELLFSDDNILEDYIDGRLIADMNIDTLIKDVKKNDLLIISKERSYILLSLLYARDSKDFPKIGAILLSGKGKLSKNVFLLLENMSNLDTIILSTSLDTYDIINKLDSLEAKLSKDEHLKISYAIDLIDESIDIDNLKTKLNANYDDIMTPFMFEHSIFQKAKLNLKNIILPEANDERILKASCFLQNKKIVNITLLGNEDDIINKSKSLGVDATNITIINPETYKAKNKMIKTLHELRKHKGLTKEGASDLLSDLTYFATMMVYMGYADGMVSGAIHTTANTIRPALQTIKTKKGINIVSSIFFMCMDTKVLIFGDCAINQNPNAQELAQIAISSEKSARQFGIIPKIAMMSYSSGDSGQGKDVDKVKEATKIIKKDKNILIEGPLQYDSAIDKKVGKLKMPNSKVAGEATVLIFPDLNTGNNTYKAVQRSANIVAIGPILQGLNKPVNDLSRGCNESDIINTVVITALQAID